MKTNLTLRAAKVSLLLLAILSDPVESGVYLGTTDCPANPVPPGTNFCSKGMTQDGTGEVNKFGVVHPMGYQGTGDPLTVVVCVYIADVFWNSPGLVDTGLSPIMGWEVSMGGTRRKFSREFKLEAVRMVTEGGYSANQVARDLDIRPDMLRRWRRQFEEDPEQAFPGVGQRKAREEEVWQLRRQLERVTAERDILKKALGIVSDRR